MLFLKFVYKLFISVVIVMIVSAHLSLSAFASSFPDVGSRYEEAVNFLVSKGMKGKTDGTFGTYEPIKRVDAAIFVVKTLGLDSESVPSSGFTDVPARAIKEVNALKAAGITNGKTETTFGSQDYITRGELAVWLTKAFKLEADDTELVFTDVGGQYIHAVKALVKYGITKGTSETTFGTQDYATRGDFAIFLYRATQIKEEALLPAIKSVKAINGRQIEVTFDEAVDAELAAYIEKAGNQIVAFDVTESARTANFVSEMISFSENKKTTTVILKPNKLNQREQELVEGKAYTVAVVSEYKEDLLIVNVKVKSDPTVLLKGLELPEVKVDGNDVVVKFDQKMDEEARNIANYEVFDAYGVKVNGVLGESAWVDATTKSAVKFKINPGVLQAGTTYKIKMNPNLEADNGSALPPSQLVTTFNTPTISKAKPKVELARVTGTNEITVAFDQDLSDSVLVNVYLFTIQRANGTTMDVSKVSFSGDSLVITTNEEDTFDEGLTYTISLPSGVAVNDRFRNAVNDEIRNIKAMAAENEAATIVNAEFIQQVDNKEKADLRLTFDQPVAIEDVEAGDINIDGYGERYLIAGGTAVSVYGGDPTGKTLVIKDVASAFARDHTDIATKFIPDIKKSYRVLIERGVTKSTAPVADFNRKTNQADLQTIVKGVDIEAPKIKKVILHSAEKVTVQFDEKIVASGLDESNLKVEGFIKSIGGRFQSATLTGSSLLKYVVNEDTLTITPTSDSVKFQTGAVESGELIVSIGADTLKDVNGIENEGMEYKVAVNDTNVYDYAAPIIIGAKVIDLASGALEITYSEAVYAKAGTAAEVAKQFNVIGTERNAFGTGSTIALAKNDARNVFDVIFTSKTFKQKDYSSAKLIYTHNSNYAVQDLEQREQASDYIIGILNEISQS